MTKFALALLAATAANASDPRGFSYGSGHGSYPVKRGEYHKNPWQHTVVTHTTAHDYQRDPFETRDSASATRSGWYSPYQQYSPPQIRYKPSVSCAIFATCTFASDQLLADNIVFAQLPGKAIVYKREFCAIGTEGSQDELVTLTINEYGYDDKVNAGDEYNPLKEIDKYGRQNPYQDPNRGTILDFLTKALDIGGGECVDIMFPDDVPLGYVDKTPQTLLQNLEGVESIMGRSVCIFKEGVEESEDGSVQGSAEINECCIIARSPVPAGYGPKPVPYPLVTHRQAYNSYGANRAVPLPYHKAGYQATAMAEDYASQVGHPVYRGH